MLLFHAPTDEQACDYLQRQAEQPFSYDFVGCTRNSPQARRGWNVDAHSIFLGQGSEVFRRACAAMDTWRMFPPDMTKVIGSNTPRPGLVVAVIYRAGLLPIWLLMPARVVYVIDEAPAQDGGCVTRHGFAYGTLPGHPERGEERFLVEWNRDTDEVHYHLLAVSQPSSWLARVGYWYARLEQARFRRLSGAAMQRAVGA